MPRRPRICPAGIVFHVLNRAVARLTLFEKETDYQAFERVLELAHAKIPLRILDYVVMPNHWHFVVWPRTDTQVSDFFRWLTHTHTMRWHAHFGTSGTGHLYQGRFKAFPIQADEHLLTVLRYVERNPVRAGLVKNAEQWKFGSAWRRAQQDQRVRHLLTEWPIPRPTQWRGLVNKPLSGAEVESVRKSVIRGTPFGGDRWTSQRAARLGLGHTLRRRGRPSKADRLPDLG